MQTSSIVLPPVCGNGILNIGEECEINMACSVGTCEQCRCLLPAPSSEENVSSSSSAVPFVCGNGIPEEGEQCDDGNAFILDGCAPSCLTEAGSVCFGIPSSCYPVCGDGIRIPPEECDDGNATDGDGCTSACTTEYAAPSEEPLLPVCGNGLLEEGEQCDDANLTDNDGCSQACITEVLSSSSSEESSSLSSVSSISSASSAPILLPPMEETSAQSPVPRWAWPLVGLVVLLLVVIVLQWLRGRGGNNA